MNSNQEKLQLAMKYAIAHSPKIGHFPFLAECLRQAGVARNVWSLPGAQCIYVMQEGAILQQGTPLVTGMVDIPPFDKEALVTAIQADQAGNSTFPEFLMATWKAGVIGYEVDFLNRNVSYFGARDEKYIESYPLVEIGDMRV